VLDLIVDGEKAGQPVPVRVRGFKIRFVMQDAR